MNDPLNHDERASLISPESHVEGFRKARDARRTELIEDYVELISDLITDGGEARQTDIARRLGVAQPTVAKMLKRLDPIIYIGDVAEEPEEGEEEYND